jgi:hypothetical protein
MFFPQAWTFYSLNREKMSSALKPAFTRFRRDLPRNLPADQFCLDLNKRVGYRVGK